MENVLVIWQLQTAKQQFIPGLGSAIISIAVSPDCIYYAVSTLGNCIHLVNAVSTRIHKTITSLVHGLLNFFLIVMNESNFYVFFFQYLRKI